MGLRETMRSIAIAMGMGGLRNGWRLADADGAAPRYGVTFPSRNGGTQSGAAAAKRAAKKRRNLRARGAK